MSEQQKDINKKEESIDKSQFEFVQKEEKIYDKKFQTKPIGYFKDAMIRFARNKTNVVATTILGILILLSIAVPALSNKNAEVLESQIAQLPPRIPVLASFGIADGTASYEDIPIDYDNPYVDEDGNQIDDLYLPSGEISEFIEEGSLTNYWLTCTDREPTCEGGLVQFAKQVAETPVGTYVTEATIEEDEDGNEVTTYKPMTLTGIWFPDEFIIEMKIDTEDAFNENVIDGSAAFTVYFQLQNDTLDMIKVFDSSDPTTYDSYEDGVFTTDIADHPELNFAPDKYRVLLAYDSEIKDSGVLEYFRMSASAAGSYYGTEGPEGTDLVYAQGYPLSQFALVTDLSDDEGELLYLGNVLRKEGQRLNAAYTVDAYARAFGPVERIGFQGSQFVELIQTCTYADGTPYDPENPVPGEFDENCAIDTLIERNDDDAVVVPGKGTFYTYDVYLNYRVYAGYDEIPYFLFGTSSAGYDMVKLIWIGLRTSLLIGLFVSFINIAIGIVYGAISGYYGGQVDIIMQRFAEIIGRIPWLVTLSIFMAYFDAGFTSLILILIVTGWIGVASITRTQFYRYKGREYVLASRTLGAKDGRLIFRHILPNGIGTIITSSILLIPTVIFSEATLSYLGFGIGHGQSIKLFGLDFLELSGVSIGVLLNDGRNKLRNYPHLTLFPAIIISILMITFNMFGNALRDAFNPSLRGSE